MKLTYERSCVSDLSEGRKRIVLHGKDEQGQGVELTLVMSANALADFLYDLGAPIKYPAMKGGKWAKHG